MLTGCDIMDYHLIDQNVVSGTAPSPTADNTAVDETQQAWYEIDNEYGEDAPVSESKIQTVREKLAVIGDSIGSGFSFYDRIAGERCSAQESVSLKTVRNVTFEVEGVGSVTAVGFMESLQPEYVLTVLGMNDCGSEDPEGFAEDYLDFVRELHQASPNTRIFVMGITPVGEYSDYDISNSMIREYNYSLSRVFDDLGWAEFVNAGSALKDDEGCLKEEFSAGDGVHLTGEAYDVMLEQVARCV